MLTVDIFPAAVQTHKHNHGPHGTITNNLDLSSTTYEQLAALWSHQTNTPPIGIIGGSPCQAFSVSNVHQRDNDLISDAVLPPVGMAMAIAIGTALGHNIRPQQEGENAERELLLQEAGCKENGGTPTQGFLCTMVSETW